MYSSLEQMYLSLRGLSTFSTYFSAQAVKSQSLLVIPPCKPCSDAVKSMDFASPVLVIWSPNPRHCCMHHEPRVPPRWSPDARKYVVQWHANMSVYSLSQASLNKSKMDGVFSPACYIHTNFTSRHPLIKGYSFMDLLHKWMGGWWKNVLSDSCGELCNPTCVPY